MYAFQDDTCKACDACLAQVAWVPGSFELPLVAKHMAKSGKFDAVITVGAVVGISYAFCAGNEYAISKDRFHANCQAWICSSRAFALHVSV